MHAWADMIFHHHWNYPGFHFFLNHDKYVSGAAQLKCQGYCFPQNFGKGRKWILSLKIICKASLINSFMNKLWKKGKKKKNRGYWKLLGKPLEATESFGNRAAGAEQTSTQPCTSIGTCPTWSKPSFAPGWWYYHPFWHPPCYKGKPGPINSNFSFHGKKKPCRDAFLLSFPPPHFQKPKTSLTALNPTSLFNLEQRQIESKAVTRKHRVFWAFPQVLCYEIVMK